MLPATRRLEAFDIDELIRQENYFVVHAPRQVGKTTAMQVLADELTASGDYISIVVSMETGAAFTDTLKAEQAILTNWRITIRSQLPSEFHPPVWFPEEGYGGGLIGTYLNEWAFAAPRPLVIFLDEIDALEDETLISVLRQLRSGYASRPKGFPSSLAIIGLRDVRDYRVASGGSQRLKSPSPFNIAVRSITLRNFTADEVKILLNQHVDESGQEITPEAMERIFFLSQGQPWLVNSLAKVCVEELEKNRQNPVTRYHVDEAKEILIQRRQVHLDQLTDKLQTKRVRSVIEPILSGRALDNIPLDDIDYVDDLGLIKRTNGRTVMIANPIYKEIIPRVLTENTEASLPQISPSWLNPNGSLNPDKLINAFLVFWRRHGQPLLKSAPYHEIAPHTVMMAFLHRVVNGEGVIDREYAIGSGKMDLYIRYEGGPETVQMAMELKVWRDGRPEPLDVGLKQLDDYMSGLSYNHLNYDGTEVETGWLVIFDQRSGQPEISERTTAASTITPAGRTVTLIRA
ncbi:MAG: AAA-like domain-containing protein [Chloroflexota bacterium]